MKTLCTFYLVRHGETEFNTKKILQGHLDSPLTEKGIADAKLLGQKLKNIRFDLVFSSDLLRAKRTAEIITSEKKLAIESTKILRERSFGELEGKPYDALKAYYELIDKLKSQKKVTLNKYSIEEDEIVVNRLITFLRETAITHPGKKILVVTHGGIMRIFLKHLGFMNLVSGSVGNLAIIKLQTDGTSFFIKKTSGIKFV